MRKEQRHFNMVKNLQHPNIVHTHYLMFSYDPKQSKYEIHRIEELMEGRDMDKFIKKYADAIGYANIKRFTG